MLDMRYPDRWMGRGGPIIRSAWSPNLNMLDYFVSGHIKDLVIVLYIKLKIIYKSFVIANMCTSDLKYWECALILKNFEEMM